MTTAIAEKAPGAEAPAGIQNAAAFQNAAYIQSEADIRSGTERMTFADKLRDGKTVVTCELVPPKAPTFSPLVRRCGLLRDQVDAINVTDCASAVLRMSPLAASKCILDEGLEVIMQTTCRDRNRLALQADLIGAWALGVRHVMALSGDFIHLGDHPMAKPVFDIDSTNYILMLDQMKRGRFFSGDEIRLTSKTPLVPMDFTIGAATNPFGVDPKISAIHMMKKIEAGADFFQTQPVFDVETFRRWVETMDGVGFFDRTRCLVGVMPPRSAKGLAFMKQEVPGVIIPDALLRRFEGAEDVKAEGVKFAQEIIDLALGHPKIAGVHFMPVGWEEIVPELATYCREKRPESS